MPDPYVLELELPRDAQSNLREILDGLGLNAENGEDLGEAIGTALSMEAFLLREASSGNKVMIIEKNGQQRELLIKWTNGRSPDHR